MFHSVRAVEYRYSMSFGLGKYFKGFWTTGH